MLSPLSRLLHLQSQPLQEGFVPITLPIFNRSSGGPNGFPGNLGKIHALSWRKYQEVAMKKALGVLAAVAVLERFTNYLNRKGFRFFGEYDSRCWLGWRPVSDGPTYFQ